jgi:putative sigma-54 modulation protein
MNITATAQGFDLSTSIDIFVREELRSALERFSEGIVSVDVFMKDINGPKGGVDKQVLIRVQLRNRRSIAIETAHTDLYAAIKNCAKKSKRVVRRNLKKSMRIGKLRLRDLQYNNEMVALPKA